MEFRHAFKIRNPMMWRVVLAKEILILRVINAQETAIIADLINSMIKYIYSTRCYPGAQWTIGSTLKNRYETDQILNF